MTASLSASSIFAIYGALPPELALPPKGARQFSPLFPGSSSFEDCSERSLSSMIMVAPPGTLERRYVMAHALRCLDDDATLTVMAPKEKGGLRLKKELIQFGCDVGEDARRHFRICEVARPKKLIGIEEALAAGGVQRVDAIGFWSQPGIFSWDRLDPGSALLVQTLPTFAGRGADVGCGFGYLARAILNQPTVRHLSLIDIDRRALDCSKRNSDDERVSFLWLDILSAKADLGKLDFVVMNPPFHDGGNEDRSLGQRFIERAHHMLREGGVCWLTANKHLPYEQLLGELFTSAVLRAQNGFYKIFECVK